MTKRRPKPQPYDDWEEVTHGFSHLLGEWRPANDWHKNGKLFVNSRYSVTVDPWPLDFLENQPPGDMLSIKKNFGGPVDDWRDKQRIKNDLCGPEREAVELYPRESDLMDTADQAWLYVLPEGLTWPFGFRGLRLVAEGRHVRGRKGSQRPFEFRPPDCKTAAEIEQIARDAQRRRDEEKTNDSEE